MLNYTVSSSTTSALAGAQVDGVTPTVTLTITADDNYTVTASDFSVGDALPSEVDSVVFTNTSTTTIECLVTFASSFVMPIGNVSLPIDIDGTANIIESTTSGTVEISGNNLNPNSTSQAYSITSLTDQSTVIVVEVFADSGYHFEEQPLVSFSGTSVPSNYRIFNASTTVVSGKIISYYFNLMYNRGEGGNVTGDEIRVVGNAVDIFVPDTKYYSYTMPGNLLGTSGVYSTTPGDASFLLQIFGDVGAEVTVDIAKNGAAATNVVTNEEIIRADGRLKIPIDMPGAVDTDTYVLTLSGDISATFTQTNPITINVNAAIIYDINVTPIPGYTITPIGTTTVSGPSGAVLGLDQINSTINAVFKITKDDGAIISLQAQPEWNNDVSNVDKATNNGTDILFGEGIKITGNGTTEVYVTALATVTEFGTADVSSLITLTGDINADPVTTDLTASVSDNGTVSIPIGGNATDADGDPMTAIIVTQPVNGTVVVDGFGFSYTHTATNSNPDGFTYKVSDGFGESNVSNVGITVTGTDTSSITPEGGAGLYRIYSDVGASASTIEVTFDAGTKPARIQLIYGGNVVAESLFVGDNLTDSNRAAAIVDATTQQTFYQFGWVGTGGNGAFYGQSAAWDVNKPVTTITYAASEIASTGNVRTVQANWDGQLGIQPDAGVDSADGNVVLSYTKPAGGSETVLIFITGIVGADWDITNITVT
jgi:hypothetical protein